MSSIDRTMQAQLADSLNTAIGSQTRLYFVQISDIDRIEEGDVSAYSQALGNIKVYTGENRWLVVGDRVYVTKVSASEKYANYFFIGWQSNAAERNPGSILAFDSTPVLSVAALPPPTLARQNQIRLVNSVPYHFTDETGWVPFGARPRQYVWFLSGELIEGPSGALVQLDATGVLTSVVLACTVVGTSDCIVDIQYSSNLSSWTSLFSARPVLAAGEQIGGQYASFSTFPLSYLAGTWLRCVVVAPGTVAELTVHLRMTT